MKPPLPQMLKSRARQLRKAQTEAEKEIWFYLRNGRLGGFKFRRQHPIQNYVVDFVCESAMLVVELDGGHHTSEMDQKRTPDVQALGYLVLRFWNNDVSQDRAAVLEEILRIASMREGLCNCE